MHIKNSRKRQHSEQHSLQGSPQGVLKKQKVDHPRGSLLLAAFWDNLSKVWLTRNALREVDRRDQQSTSSALSQVQSLIPLTLQRFARQGGPDLSDLRGYPEPEINTRRSNYRVQKRSASSRSVSRGSSTSRSNKPSTTKTSEPYDRDFQQHLIDHGIYPHAYEYPDGRIPRKPRNWSGIKERLARRRSSLSPSKFTDEMHAKFVRADAHPFKEKHTESVIPVIEGDNGDDRCVAGGIPFRNLDPLTDGTLVPGNPDRYYGARPEQLNRQVRSELDGQIVPSTQHDLPVAPNFFLAAKGPDGSASVARKQASYDGALGARGIHSLQEHGKDEPEFDNNAYIISSIKD